VTVREIDHGADALMRRLLERAVVHVGVQGEDGGEAHTDGDETIAQVAAKHEFGGVSDTGAKIPRRSFIRDYVDQNIGPLEARLERLGVAVLQGYTTVEQGLEAFGLRAVGEIQQRIADRISPPLSKITIARKGSDVPLIDTGQLRNSITHKVDND